MAVNSSSAPADSAYFSLMDLTFFFQINYVGGFWDTPAVMHVEDCLSKETTVLFV